MPAKRKAVAAKNAKKQRVANRAAKRARVDSTRDRDDSAAPSTTSSADRKAYVLEEDEEEGQRSEREANENSPPRLCRAESVASEAAEPEDAETELGECFR